MGGLLILKQLYNLSDEAMVDQWQMNPYFHVFCGAVGFQIEPPCHATELVKFRQRIGEEGAKRLFGLAVSLHGKAAEEPIVLVDTTVQEKMITYPTDSKLAIKIINRLNKLAKAEGIWHAPLSRKSRHCDWLADTSVMYGVAVKQRKPCDVYAIAGILLRELKRKLPDAIQEREAERFALYERVLVQQPKDKNKVYSLHEPDVYCVGKGKDHKPYEYGRKASVVATPPIPRLPQHVKVPALVICVV